MPKNPTNTKPIVTLFSIYKTEKKNLITSISHRLSTERFANRIIEIQKGSIAETGMMN